ncbi:hypothetical protein [Haloprofundus salilacus]|uniref:hypothetical protein n=1 Tax=Haloprofundus salilacus TaxID=2876190 RepID=UPI001CCF91C6|nr:hypothetical protein [Haloprofundus salilacus]
MSSVADRVRTHLLAEESALLDGIADCADAVASGWAGESTTERAKVVPPLKAVLARAGITDQLPGLLARCVDAAGFELAAPPVAAPPYVVVTATGPVLRATLDPSRLVISLRVFEVERGDDCRDDGSVEIGRSDGDGETGGDRSGEPRYRRRGETPEELVCVELR